MVYKALSNDLIIDNAQTLVNVLYKVLGKPVTNFAINNSIGDLFTSGETIDSLLKDIANYEKRSISSIANYAAEGLSSMDDNIIKAF